MALIKIAFMKMALTYLAMIKMALIQMAMTKMAFKKMALMNPIILTILIWIRIGILMITISMIRTIIVLMTGPFFLSKLFYSFYSLDKLKPKTKTKIQNIFWWCKWKFDFFLLFEWGDKKTIFLEGGKKVFLSPSINQSV